MAYMTCGCVTPTNPIHEKEALRKFVWGFEEKRLFNAKWNGWNRFSWFYLLIWLQTLREVTVCHFLVFKKVLMSWLMFLAQKCQTSTFWSKNMFKGDPEQIWKTDLAKGFLSKSFSTRPMATTFFLHILWSLFSCVS